MENKPFNFQTPKKNFKNGIISIPASPFLKRLGYGTGVQVYEFTRSPKINSVKSPWAVKIVKSKTENKLYSKRLQEEASLLRKMDNPYIVGFRQFSKNVDGKECLAMEECTSSLADLIEKRAEKENVAFSPNKILKVALDISKALSYLHDTVLLLHGDIKSHNVLIKGDFNICKLCDFGVSLPLKENGELDTTKADNVEEYVGTICWSAPEVLREPPHITSKADIFSYGLVLWEMMTLSIPHNNIDEEELELNESDNFEEPFGTRPAVPDYILEDNTEAYTHPLELFYCCTVEDPKNRPRASLLTAIINEMLENK